LNLRSFTGFAIQIDPAAQAIRNDAVDDMQAEAAAEVTVSDSGKGIPADNLTSIFDAFFTTKPQGTGLGLPIARTILESYGGAIWAENSNRGAMFSFRLPLAKTHAG
jgi:signal transduction histidine kinase